jgi:cytochrome c oxidase subunit II
VILDIHKLFGEASNLAAGVDKTFIFIFSVAIFFIVGITGFMIYSVIKFNRKKGKPARQFSKNITLEILWTVIPTVLVIIMFYLGWIGFRSMREVPKDALEIKAIGRQWEWEFDYGKGKISKYLVVPINKPVKLNLHSEDVNHSLFIPAFRIKEDVVPGYNNFLWFTATDYGVYEIYCAEYCGLLHSNMLDSVKVVSDSAYLAWYNNLEATGNKPEPEGLTILKANACLGCHSLDGSKLVGPSFKGLFNSKVTVMENGVQKTIIADEAYIKSSILAPNKDIVSGFSKGLMQSYREKLTDEQITKIIDYLKTQK